MISYYELLGMIKEGNNPKKVKFNDIIFNWCYGYYIYGVYVFLTNYLSEKQMFDKNIEIIEEDKDIKEIISGEITMTSYKPEQIRTDMDVLTDKINELIREVNKLRKEDK